MTSKKPLAVIISIWVVVLSLVFASQTFAIQNESTKAAGKIEEIQERLTETQQKQLEIKNRLASVEAKLSEAKQKILARVRQVVVAHWNIFNKAITRSEILLSKLQIRIDRAKAASNNVDNINKLMEDSRAKLTDAKTRLASIESKKGTAITKAEYELIRADYKAILKDLQTIRQNSAKVISQLKAFNRSAKAPEPKATRSATIKPTATPSPVATTSATPTP